ncbi:hypothetical protein FRB97_000804 [Tulasnella sp. 331]|nr:hypothetical protein FRB98_003330 [Tulasnella sp. 332]KAG8869690.1 hypothetical protein FRB97_000804 [Tulasnella sp. 331]
MPAPAPNTPVFAASPSGLQGPWSRATVRPISGMLPESLKQLGDRNYRIGEYESAISFYTQAIELKPDPVFFSNRAAALMMLKLFKVAVDDCHIAALLSRHAPCYKILARLAKCHLALGEPEAAIAAAQASINCDSIASADNPSHATKAAAEQMKRHLDLCEDAWERKAWETAKKSLVRAVALCEGVRPAEWCVWEVEIAMARCDWVEAAVAATIGSQLHPNSASVQTAIAQVNLFTNRTFASALSLRAALQIEPSHPRARTLLSRVEAMIEAQQAGERLYLAGQIIDASMRYTEALELLGSAVEEGQGGYLRVTLLGNRAAAYMKMRRFDLARDDGIAALSIPNHPWRLEVLDKLSRCYIALGDADGALQQVNNALEIDPLDNDILALRSSAKSMQSNLRRSRASWAKREWLDAKQALALAIAECTGDCPVQWWIWTVEMEMATRNWAGALTTAEAIVELHPSSAHVLALLGLVRMLSDNLSSCLEPLQLALRLDSQHSMASKTLLRVDEIERLREEGQQASELGRYPDAVQSYTQALGIVGSSEEEGGGGLLRAVLLASRAPALLNMERPSRALADVVISLELQPASLLALHTHARVRMAQGYYEEAITIYTQASKVWIAGQGDVVEGRMISQGLLGAEAALKSSQSKNYHSILRRAKFYRLCYPTANLTHLPSIPNSASDPEIKKAYKRSCLLFHPDKGGNPEHFKLVSEAYNALSAS